MVISQSGETADTLAAQREAKQKGSKTLAICNVVGSMITREAAGTLMTHAGPEIGVASTKAFTSQLTALFLLAMYLGQLRDDARTRRRRDMLVQELLHLPGKLEDVLRARPHLRRSGEGAVPRHGFSVPRPRHPFPDRAGRRAEAEGDFLHPRRRLSGRRDEARAQRADRRESSGGGAGHARSSKRMPAACSTKRRCRTSRK